MMSRQSAADKSFTYFALLEAFGKSGCPVCRLMEEYSLSYLDALFYEQVNDVGTRRKLREARGFCNWHAWQTKRIATNAFGVAIIAKELISEELTQLKDLLRRPRLKTIRHASGSGLLSKPLSTYIQEWRRRRICPACEVILEHERHALETILNFLHEPAFARRFEAGAPLCLVHTMRAAGCNDCHPHLHMLIDMQCRKYAGLVAELEEFCRKQDYRFSHQPWGQESDSWLRAIEVLAGRPNVFGNDVHRKRRGRSQTRWWRTMVDRCLRITAGEIPSRSATEERA
jgi:hypothetical protein